MKTKQLTTLFMSIVFGGILTLGGLQVYSWYTKSIPVAFSVVANADINGDRDINDGPPYKVGSTLFPGKNMGEDSGVNFFPGNTIYTIFGGQMAFPVAEGNETIIIDHHNPEGTCMYGTGLPVLNVGSQAVWNPSSLFIEDTYAASTIPRGYYSTDHGQSWVEYNTVDMFPTVEGCVITDFRITDPISTYSLNGYALTTLPDYKQDILVDSLRLYVKDNDTAKETDFVNARYVMYPLGIKTCLTGTASLSIVDRPIDGSAGICGSASGSLLETGSLDAISSQTGFLCAFGSASRVSASSGAIIDATGKMVIGNIYQWTCGGTPGQYNGSTGTTMSCQAYGLLSTVAPIATGTPTPTQPVFPISSGGGGGSQTMTMSPGVITLPATSTTVAPETKTVTPTSSSTPPKKQCVSIIKNLDDGRLVAYASQLKVQDFSDTDRRLTRAEFLKVVVNSTQGDLIDSTGVTLPFRDIQLKEWYIPYLRYALNHEIISSGEVFRPNDLITRAEAAKIFVKITGIEHLSKNDPFADTFDAASLKPYIATAYYNCLLHGRNTIDGVPLVWPRVFEPYDSISIGETMKVLYNEKYK